MPSMMHERIAGARSGAVRLGVLGRGGVVGVSGSEGLFGAVYVICLPVLWAVYMTAAIKPTAAVMKAAAISFSMSMRHILFWFVGGVSDVDQGCGYQ